MAAPIVPGAGRTLGQLCEAVFSLPEFSGQQVQGRMIKKGLAEKTIWGYRHNSRWVEGACQRLAARRNAPDLWDCPAAAITPETMQMIIEEIWQKSGLASARAARAFLSQMWTRLGRKEPRACRTLFEDMPRMPVAEGRVRPWTVEEFMHMVATADRLGRPEIGDMIVYGALHGQRQTDRLVITVDSETATHITVRQSKRGKLVTLAKPPLLAMRLAAANMRSRRCRVWFLTSPSPRRKANSPT